MRLSRIGSVLAAASVVLVLVLIGDLPRGQNTALAAPQTKPFFIAAGKTYEFTFAGGKGKYSVMEVRSDGWLKIELGMENIWLNLNQTILVRECGQVQ